MKKGLKISAIVLGVILLVMIILPFAFAGKIEGIVKTEGNKLLNARFDFEKLDISLFRNFPQASLTLNGFWMKGLDEFENDTLIATDRLTATVNVFSLFGDSGFDITSIQLDDTYVKAIVLPDGRVNWDVMKADSTDTEDVTAETDDTPFRISLKSVTVDNLNVIYDDRQSGMYADITDFGMQMSGDFSSDQTLLKIDAEAGSLTYRMNQISLLNRVNLAIRMDIDADMLNRKFTLRNNEFRLNAIRANLDGWLAFNDPSIEMDLSVNSNKVGFKDILSLIPAVYAKDFKNLQADGTVSLTASAKGIMQGDTLPRFMLDMNVQNGSFRYPSLPAGIDDINIKAHVSNPGGSIDLTSIRISPFSFRLGNNPFSLSAAVSNPVSDAAFDLNAKGTLNLGMIEQVYPLDDMDLNGMLHADMSLSGRYSYVEKEQYEKVQASGMLQLNDMKLDIKDMPDVTIRKSTFTFTPRYLQLSETTAMIGQNDITADSRFENYIGFLLRDQTLKGNLTIRSNRFNLNDFMSGTDENIPAETGEHTSSGLLIIPRNIDFTMDARMKEVMFDSMVFTDMNGKLSIKDGKADMNNLSMKTMGGTMVLNGYYSTTDTSNPVFNAGFRMNGLNFAQTYKELNMVQKLAPVFENLKGSFSGTMNIRTNLDKEMSPVLPTMQGSGSLTTRDMELSGVKVIDQLAGLVNKPELKNITVKDLNLDFAIKDGRVATTPFDIKFQGYVLNLSGSTGLDQTIDYSGKIRLPASAGTIGQLSSVDFKIGGTFTAPNVSLDTKSMAGQVVESAKDIAIEKIGKELGLDSAIVSNKDSIRKKATEKVTEKALDFLKKLK